MTYSDESIVSSWLDNATPWVTAVRQNEIESRVLITNKAITAAILEKSPETVLDIGCGEGWLARELNKTGIHVLGIDAIPELVAAATAEGGGIFKVMSYEDLTKGAIKEEFDIVVCNFSLLGDVSVNNIFQYIPNLLNKQGYFIIQTVHPATVSGDGNYQDGWRKGSWAGFSNKFSNPAPWYFRTLETWKTLFRYSNLNLIDLIEPVNPQTKKAASVIFVAKLEAKKSPNLPDKANVPSS